MKNLKLLAIAALLSTHCFGQWKQINSLGTNVNLEDIYCTNKDTCYAVGINGTIFRITDGGSKWTQLNSGTTAWFMSVCFINSQVGFVVGEEFLKTIDAGNSWQSPQTLYGQRIYFYDDSIGYIGGAGGGQLRKTTDAGETWDWTNLYKVAKGWVNSIFFTNENTGYVTEGIGTAGRVFKTSDGGNNWKQVFTNPQELNSVFFANDSIGYVVGSNGVIFKTKDTGNTWDTLISGTTKVLFDIFCLNQDTCYAVGSYATVLQTTDRGNNWTPQNITPNGAGGIFLSVFFSGTTGYAVGNPDAIKTDIGVGMVNINRGKEIIDIYPNLIEHDKILNIVTKNKQYNNLYFMVYDVLGKKIKQASVLSEHTQVDVSNLESGFYIYLLTNNSEVISTGKIIIQ